MSSETTSPVSPEEARSSLAEIDRIGSRVRRAINAGCAAPLLILWGAIWIVGFTAEQFLAHSHRFWLPLDLAGIAGSVFLGGLSRGTPAKSPFSGRIGLSWAILFGYAILWCSLLSPPFLERKLAVLWVTACMFAYIIMGLWLDRFLVWLGALVTFATLLGYAFAPAWLYLWIAIGGGGALMVSGLVIRKRWR